MKENNGVSNDVKDTVAAEAARLNGTGTSDNGANGSTEKTEQKQETVPLSVFLELKKDFRDLKESKGSVSDKDIKTLAEKLGVEEADISGLVTKIKAEAKAEAKAEIDQEYAPHIQKQEAERRTATFNKAFDNVFEKTLKDNPDYAEIKIDKEVVKTLALTEKYKNTPLPDILKELYGGIIESGKETAENGRNAGDVVDEVVDITNLTAEQRSKIMDDPKLRAQYFAKLDAAGK